MADEAKAPQGNDSMKTVQGLAIILIVVLAVFMVTSLNKVKGELVKMNQQMQTLVSTTAQNSPGMYQAVAEDGEVQFRFAPVPTTMMGMGAVGGMSGQASPAGSAAGTTAAPGAMPAAK